MYSVKMDKSEEFDLKSKIFYFRRIKHWNHMLNAAKEGTTKFKGDACFHLYHTLALILVNRLEEGVHELETIHMENDIKLAVTIALMYTHKLLGITNKDVFAKLDNQLREYRKSAEAVDFYHSAFVLLCFNKAEKALEYAEKSLNIQSASPDCLNLKGWILLQLSCAKKANDAKELFQNSLQIDPKYLDTILGYTECCLFQDNISEALNTINKAVVRYTSTNLPLVQKLRIHLTELDWDQAIETLNRISNTDAKNLYIQKVLIIILLCRSANKDEAVIEIRKYFKILEAIEPGNIQLILESAELFSRICGKHQEILSETQKIIEVVLQHHQENTDIVIELGYELLISGKTKEAMRYFKNATKIEEASFKALLGFSLCELAESGHTNQLKQQVDFLLEMRGASSSLLLNFLQAKISDDSEQALKHLTFICETKISQLKHYPFNDDYLLLLDPNLVMDVVKEYMQHLASMNTLKKGSRDVIQELLNILVRCFPGSPEALFLLAKLQYVKGDISNALQYLEQLLSNVVNPETEAQLLMAQIQVQHGMFDRAMQSLESCMSHNFKVRENPIYHFINALVDKNTNNYGDAIKSLSTALNLINMKDKGGYSKSNVCLSEKASIYVELIDTLNIVGQSDEATKILEDATEDLKGTPEEARILLLSAEHCLKRKNIQGALDLISRIKATDSCYMEAKTKHADILLNYRKDKYAFLKCYQDFVDENPGVDSYVMLADAYMKVLEPDDALEYYEKALKENPSDPYLTSKMGKALIDTHYFSRAVDYYRDTIKKTNDLELKLQLADLYMNLREYEKGELILLNELEDDNGNMSEDLTYLQQKTRLLVLLAQLQEKSGNITYALKSLKDAMDNQNRVRKRFAVEQNVTPEKEVKTLVDISMKLGEMAIALKNNEQAINYYKEGLSVSPNNITILTALAKLYMQMNYLELCQQTCSTILKIDPENEAASVMMADIAFRKIDFDMALFHFTQLVTKQPGNFEALIRLIEILRRTGNIDDAPQYLAIAEKYCENPNKETRFSYCKALYQMYSGNLNGALRNFNHARNDPELGQSAIYNMIEICLNPDDEMLAEQFMDVDDIEYKDSRSMALKTADRLLKELRQKIASNGDDVLKYKLLTNFRLLATKEKSDIERALDDFVALTSENAYKDNIVITFGIASAYTLLKQSQRAKNQLKRVVKSTWTYEDAEYLERCWLLLADYYIQSTKYDIATDLINKILLHNKSCNKAYEYLGYISEKEQHYKDAANHYEQTWKFGGKTNPSIGFKLAYCLMKCKKYPGAIDVAQEVLRLSPEYPRVKKDILDKCMNNLRI